MANKSKAKGTAFETAMCLLLCKLTKRTVRRLTLHGNKDIGDLDIHGLDVTVEAKAPGAGKPLSLAAWVDETAVEKTNKGTKWSVLLVRRPGKPDAPYAVVPLPELVALWNIAENHRIPRQPLKETYQ